MKHNPLDRVTVAVLAAAAYCAGYGTVNALRSGWQWGWAFTAVGIIYAAIALFGKRRDMNEPQDAR